jgi:hypothetical protein
MVHSTWTVDDITDLIPMNDTSGDPRVFCLRSQIDGSGMEMVSPSNRASEEFVAATWKSSQAQGMGQVLAPGVIIINGRLFLSKNFFKTVKKPRSGYSKY